MPAKPKSTDDDSSQSWNSRSGSIALDDRGIDQHHQNDQQRQQRGETIADCVRDTVSQFLQDLNGEEVTDLYNMVIKQVEKPLIEVVMQHTLDNQSKASRLLGVNRNTLRKKLMVHKIKDAP